MFKIQGTIIELSPKRTGVSNSTGNPWSSQQMVVEYSDGTYPRRIVLDMFNKDDIVMSVGDFVEIDFTPMAKQWTDKNGQQRWFGSNNVTSVSVLKKSGNQPQTQPQQYQNAPQQQQYSQGGPFYPQGATQQQTSPVPQPSTAVKEDLPF